VDLNDIILGENPNVVTNQSMATTSSSTSNKTSTSSDSTVPSSSSEPLDPSVPQLDGDPEASNITAQSFTIAFTTTKATNVQIEYSLNQTVPVGYGIRYPMEPSGYPNTDHQIMVASVENGKTYYYRILLYDHGELAYISNQYSLTTLEDDGVDTELPMLIVEPYLKDISTDSATICWVTDEYTTAQIIYNIIDDFTSPLGVIPLAPGTITTNIHEVTLTGLTESETYYYKLQSLDANGNALQEDSHSFRTQSHNGTPVGWIGGGHYTGFNPAGSAFPSNSPGCMYNPADVELDASGNIYVVDYYYHRVQKWDSMGNYVGWIGYDSVSGMRYENFGIGGTPDRGDQEDGFDNPEGIAVDDGYLYISDTDDHRIQKWTTDGVYVGWIGKDGTGYHEDFQTGGNYSDNDSGNGDGQFNTPLGIAVGTTTTPHYLYIADYSNCRIQKWTVDGQYIGWIGYEDSTTPHTGFATGPTCYTGSAYNKDHIYNPRDVEVDDTATNLYVTVQGFDMVHKWSISGTFGGWIGGGASDGLWQTDDTQPLYGQMDRHFDDPYYLAMDSFDNLYVSNSDGRVMKWYVGNSGNVARYRGWVGHAYGWNVPHSNFIPGDDPRNSGTYYFSFNSPRGLDVDSEGSIYIVDHNNHRLQKWE